MTKWSQEALDEALDEAVRDGMAVRTTAHPTPEESRTMRNALYNRAKARGFHRDLEFALEGTHVVLRRKPVLQGLVRPVEQST